MVSKERRKGVLTTKTYACPAGSTAPVQLPRGLGLHFNDPKERQAHIQAFLAWLPSMLKTAPGVCWERLPSVVMGYLIRADDMAERPDMVAITLAVG
jgi:hypothetical protein